MTDQGAEKERSSQEQIENMTVTALDQNSNHDPSESSHKDQAKSVIENPKASTKGPTKGSSGKTIAATEESKASRSSQRTIKVANQTDSNPSGARKTRGVSDKPRKGPSSGKHKTKDTTEGASGDPESALLSNQTSQREGIGARIQSTLISSGQEEFKSDPKNTTSQKASKNNQGSAKNNSSNSPNIKRKKATKGGTQRVDPNKLDSSGIPLKTQQTFKQPRGEKLDQGERAAENQSSKDQTEQHQRANSAQQSDVVKQRSQLGSKKGGAEGDTSSDKMTSSLKSHLRKSSVNISAASQNKDHDERGRSAGDKTVSSQEGRSISDWKGTGIGKVGLSNKDSRKLLRKTTKSGHKVNDVTGSSTQGEGKNSQLSKRNSNRPNAINTNFQESNRQPDSNNDYQEESNTAQTAGGESLEARDKPNELPASPASKIPSPLQIQSRQNNVSEIKEMASEESPSPVSASMRMTSSRYNQQKDESFGIRLQKIENSNLIENSAKTVTQAGDISLGEVGEKSYPQSPEMLKVQPDDDLINKEKVNVNLPEPLPLLPKATNQFNIPPKCPIDSIRFIQLKRFQQFQKQLADAMSVGYDLVGQRRKMLQLKTEEKIKKGTVGGEGDSPLVKIDDTTHFIKSIVYARDPNILDEHNNVNQRAAFQHQNVLDIKTLIRKKELYGEEKSFTTLQPRTLQRQQAYQKPQEAFIYKLKKDEDDKTLLFESRFESGNLYLAQKVSDSEYNLLMSNDVNTSGHTQWFFFQVKNTRAKSKVKFNILNYSKPDSLFNYGMKVSVYSEKKAEKQSIGWHKDAEEIRYFQNGIRKDITYYSKSYYTATFTYTFEEDLDVVYFAYSTPYTFSDLRSDLSCIETDPERSKFIKKQVLCKTLSGEDCQVLTITSRDNLENFSQRKGVVLTARVHPGETVGSWMMRGVLTFLTDPNNHEAKLLRENFVFKVIPMLNPDGVINGNYRCSLAGCDLNRRWKAPSKVLHPTIFATKKLVKELHLNRGCVLFCDLHGHSRKQNVFMYGCNKKDNPGECRIFPFILSKINAYFCFEYSRFGVQKSKESTARVALFKELKNCPNIFTMESSFAGCDMGKAAGKHLSTEMLETLGHDVCRSILIYCNMYCPPELRELPFFKNMFAKKKSAAPVDSGKKTFAEDKNADFKNAFLEELNNNKKYIEQGDGDSTSGSDSQPSEDNMQAEELVKQLPTTDKTLKLQLKKNQEQRKKIFEEQKKDESPLKLRRKSSGTALQRQQKRQESPVKKKIESPHKETEKPEEPKKVKPETRDAATQTERKDYAIIKEREIQKRQAEQQKLEMLKSKQFGQSSSSSQAYHHQLRGDPKSELGSLKGGNTRQTTNLYEKQLMQTQGGINNTTTPGSLQQNHTNVNHLQKSAVISQNTGHLSSQMSQMQKGAYSGMGQSNNECRPSFLQGGMSNSQQTKYNSYQTTIASQQHLNSQYPQQQNFSGSQMLSSSLPTSGSQQARSVTKEPQNKGKLRGLSNFNPEGSFQQKYGTNQSGVAPEKAYSEYGQQLIENQRNQRKTNGNPQMRQQHLSQQPGQQQQAQSEQKTSSRNLLNSDAKSTAFQMQQNSQKAYSGLGNSTSNANNQNGVQRAHHQFKIQETLRMNKQATNMEINPNTIKGFGSDINPSVNQNNHSKSQQNPIMTQQRKIENDSQMLSQKRPHYSSSQMANNSKSAIQNSAPHQTAKDSNKTGYNYPKNYSNHAMMIVSQENSAEGHDRKVTEAVKKLHEQEEKKVFGKNEPIQANSGMLGIGPQPNMPPPHQQSFSNNEINRFINQMKASPIGSPNIFQKVNFALPQQKQVPQQQFHLELGGGGKSSNFRPQKGQNGQVMDNFMQGGNQNMPNKSKLGQLANSANATISNSLSISQNAVGIGGRRLKGQPMNQQNNLGQAGSNNQGGVNGHHQYLATNQLNKNNSQTNRIQDFHNMQGGSNSQMTKTPMIQGQKSGELQRKMDYQGHATNPGHQSGANTQIRSSFTKSMPQPQSWIQGQNGPNSATIHGNQSNRILNDQGGILPALNLRQQMSGSKAETQQFSQSNAKIGNINVGGSIPSNVQNAQGSHISQNQASHQQTAKRREYQKVQNGAAIIHNNINASQIASKQQPNSGDSVVNHAPSCSQPHQQHGHQSHLTHQIRPNGPNKDNLTGNNPANHHRNQGGNIFSMGISGIDLTNKPQSNKQQNVKYQVGSLLRTPGGKEDFSKTSVQGPKKSGFMPNNTANYGSVSHENSNTLKDQTFASVVESSQKPAEPDLNSGNNNQARARNMSEIGDHRNTASNNYGTYDAVGGQQPVGSPTHQNLSKRSIHSNNSQGKSAGKRYSRN